MRASQPGLDDESALDPEKTGNTTYFNQTGVLDDQSEDDAKEPNWKAKMPVFAQDGGMNESNGTEQQERSPGFGQNPLGAEPEFEEPKLTIEDRNGEDDSLMRKSHIERQNNIFKEEYNYEEQDDEDSFEEDKVSDLDPAEDGPP
jgi:hypothetical protein